MFCKREMLFYGCWRMAEKVSGDSSPVNVSSCMRFVNMFIVSSTFWGERGRGSYLDVREIRLFWGFWVHCILELMRGVRYITPKCLIQHLSRWNSQLNDRQVVEARAHR
jgi:hypothetical protein